MPFDSPPRIATWLAHRLIATEYRESLLGDLAEQYSVRRSRLWHWRQVLAAIMVSAVADVRDHKLLALRAVALSAVLYVGLASVVIEGVTTVRLWMLAANATVCPRYDPASVRCDFWLVSFVVMSLTPRVLSCLASATIGWVVARWNRSAAASSVLLVATIQFLFEYGWITWMFAAQGIFPNRPGWTVHTVLAVTRPASVLLGGLWALRSSPGTRVLASRA
jgi:hypothetical protein